MKLMALKNFRDEDKKRGLMVTRQKGDPFEKDPSTEGEEIYCLLQGGQVTIIDEKYVPANGRYKCVYGFSFMDGERNRWALPNSEYELPQEVACKFLVSGHIVPVNENQWTPKRLLTGSISEQPVKRMFDDIESPKENWIRKGMR